MDPERMAAVAAHARQYAEEHYQARFPHHGEQEARKGAGSAALSVAVFAVANPVAEGEWYGALMARVGHFFRGHTRGAESARFVLEHYSGQAEKHARLCGQVADILEQSQVDMGDDGRCVRELRAFVEALRVGSTA
jgi:hypothetical protein